jgi:hypothetical protein
LFNAKNDKKIKKKGNAISEAVVARTEDEGFAGVVQGHGSDVAAW